MIKFDGNFIIINTLTKSLVFEIKRFYFDNASYNEEHQYLKYISYKYYGPSSELKELTPASTSLIPPSGSNRDYNTDYLVTSFFGNGNNSEVSILLKNSDNSYTNRFFFKEAKIIEGEVSQKGPRARGVKKTLDIVEYDEVSKIEIHNYYSIFDDSDVIVSKKKIVNLSENDIAINRLMSLELAIPNRKMKIHTYDGAWLFERYRHEVILDSGTYVNQSQSGYSSHKHNPYFEVEDLTTNNIYAFNLIYSGNHKGIVDINPIEHTSVMIGVNDFSFEYELKANESFMTPEAIFVVGKSQDEITHAMHEFALNHVINPNFVNKDRPILFNSWEGSTFSINETNLLEMAEVSKELGIELFVIDDGWFKGRNNDFTSLGDWVADLNKFPKGIGHFADKIHNLDLKFGIWVEPEMISIESDLFKAHPEFALMSDKRFPLERRHQLIIDLTNPKVIDYLDEVLSNLISETKADYIKWDFNRSITDIYSSCGTKAGEYFHKFVLGLYDLLDRLTSKFPNVLFEGCASGGGRFDLGIAYYFPQTWGSDNSNSSCRLRVASGTFTGYPISNFGSHIAREHFNDSPYYYSCLEDRFNIQAFGAFGYEFDVRKTNEFEREIIKEQIKYFKEHRKLFVYGDYFNIGNIFDDPRYCSFSTVSHAKDEALLFVAMVDKSAPSKTWKFKNLNEDYIYEIEIRSQYNQQEYNIAPMSGYDLMNKGVDLGNFIDPNLENEEFQSRLIYIKKL